MVILSLACFGWMVSSPSQLVKLPNDDEHIGKIIQIYPSAGKFALMENFYFGKNLATVSLPHHNGQK